jgi:hypothetical protein
MNEYEKLNDVCQKFIEKKYSIEDLSRTLSWLGVPLQIQEKVTEAEQKLEEIRFLVSNNEQYEMALDVVRDILSKVKELENK